MCKGDNQNRPKPKIGFRTAGRLTAVQGLYLMENTGYKTQEVITDLHEMIDNGIVQNVEKAHCDFVLMEDIIKGVVKNQATIDPAIVAVLPEKWTIKRLDRVMCAILRAGLYELLYHKEVPAKIVMNEYINMASAFGLNQDNDMISGILNKIARTHRLIKP
ncbi:MAG: transcription antitermination factor NusB [Pseudomonadota bacterium]